MTNQEVVEVLVPKKSPARLARRVTGNNGALLDPSGIDSLSYRVTDRAKDPPTTIVPMTPLSPVSNFIFPNLLTDPNWKRDQIGYNVLIPIDGTVTNQPVGHTLRVELWIGPVEDPEFPVLWDLVIQPESYGP